MSQELANLVKKLALIKGDIGAIEKDAKHQQGYSYYSSESILGMLNQKTSEQGIMIIPSSTFREVVTPEDGLTRVFYDYQFLIIDADSGASITATWSQDAPMSMATKAGAVIADDKASGKAHTYAFKYWLMKVFMVSSKDDVDLDANHQQERKQTQAPKADNQAPKPQVSLAQKVYAWAYDKLNLDSSAIDKMLGTSLGNIKADVAFDAMATILLAHNSGNIDKALKMAAQTLESEATINAVQKLIQPE